MDKTCREHQLGGKAKKQKCLLGIDRLFVTDRSTKTKSGSKNTANSIANKAAKKEQKEYRAICDKLAGSSRCNMTNSSWLRMKNHPDFESASELKKADRKRLTLFDLVERIVEGE